MRSKRHSVYARTRGCAIDVCTPDAGRAGRMRTGRAREAGEISRRGTAR